MHLFLYLYLELERLQPEMSWTVIGSKISKCVNVSDRCKEDTLSLTYSMLCEKEEKSLRKCDQKGDNILDVKHKSAALSTLVEAYSQAGEASESSTINEASSCSSLCDSDSDPEYVPDNENGKVNYFKLSSAKKNGTPTPGFKLKRVYSRPLLLM